MPTLEERVAALEDQMAAIENSKYQMSYSGEELEATLDFVKDRNLISGKDVATLLYESESAHTYKLDTNIKNSDFINPPIFIANLLRTTSAGTEFILNTTTMYVSNRSGGYLTIYATTEDAVGGNTVKIAYTFFAKTVTS